MRGAWAVVGSVAAALGAGLTVAVLARGGGLAVLLVVLIPVVGWSFVAAAVLAWRRGSRRLGVLFLAVALAWFVHLLDWTHVPALVAVGAPVRDVYAAVLAHLLLAFPAGRLGSTRLRLLAAAGYLDTVVLHATGAEAPAGLALAVAVVTVLLRRPRTPVTTAGAVAAAALAANLLIPGFELATWVLVEAALAAVPLTFLATRPTSRLAASAPSAAFPVGMASTPSGGFPVGTASTPSAGFPVGTASTPSAAFPVGTASTPSAAFPVGTASTPSAAFPVETASVAEAIIPSNPIYPVKEASSVDVGSLAGTDVPVGSPAGIGRVGVGFPAGTGTVGVGFPAGAGAVGVDFPAGAGAVGVGSPAGAGSPVGLAAAVAAERRRIERDLHDGAQQRLVSVAYALGLARSRLAGDPADAAVALADAQSGLARALDELRRLSQGIHPGVLVERGLRAAIAELGWGAPVPVRVRWDAPDRLPEAEELTAYYLVAEALANVAKHADATEAKVWVARRKGRLTITISDDGRGGADPAGGTGLRGLADRVTRAGGRLILESPLSSGTTIRAELPCG